MLTVDPGSPSDPLAVRKAVGSVWPQEDRASGAVRSQEASSASGLAEARRGGPGPATQVQDQDPDAVQGGPQGKGKGKAKGKTGGDTLDLSPEARVMVSKLQARDSEVRAHEAAHMAAGGGVVHGGASYSFQHGPDGRSYAVGGEVGVDTSPVKGDPSATIAKANQIRAAALAPADPSPQDQSVAASATAMASQAASDLAKQESKPGAAGASGTGEPQEGKEGAAPFPGGGPRTSGSRAASYPEARRASPAGTSRPSGIRGEGAPPLPPEALPSGLPAPVPHHASGAGAEGEKAGTEVARSGGLPTGTYGPGRTPGTGARGAAAHAGRSLDVTA